MAAPGMCKCVYPNLFHNINTLIALIDLCSSISSSANGETRKISILQSKAYKLKIISFLFALYRNGCHIIVVIINSSTLLIGPDLSLSLSLAWERILSSVADPIGWLLVSLVNNFHWLLVSLVNNFHWLLASLVNNFHWLLVSHNY